MRSRVVVADQSEARFYDVAGVRGPLRLAHRLIDPAAHLHNRDMVSDKPGRVFDHASGAGRRGSVAHHATGGERTPRKEEALSFARKIAADLARGVGAEFDRVVLMAGPAFLGLLREVLPKTVEAVVAAEVNKDLVHGSDADIMAHMPWDELA
ncbi:MAG TPA: host attachment protein [Steroidobacteraceae bacterium]|nr:host attachment protein [Steroidobacteraceae bacterium]